MFEKVNLEPQDLAFKQIHFGAQIRSQFNANLISQCH